METDREIEIDGRTFAASIVTGTLVYKDEKETGVKTFIIDHTDNTLKISDGHGTLGPLDYVEIGIGAMESVSKQKCDETMTEVDEALRAEVEAVESWTNPRRKKAEAAVLNLGGLLFAAQTEEIQRSLIKTFISAKLAPDALAWTKHLAGVVPGAIKLVLFACRGAPESGGRDV